MGRSRYKTVADGKTYFASSAIVNWIPIFAVPELAKIVLDSMQFLHVEKRITLHAYVLMENHFHIIASSPEFSNEIRKMKSFTARSIVDRLEKHGPKSLLEQFRFYKKQHKKDQTYQVWQEGFHPKIMLNEKILNQKTEYIHYNPVRRGYVDKPEHWRYSSCRHYFGGESLIPVEVLV
jgi:REP element-mobilizing transposase RayT